MGPGKPGKSWNFIVAFLRTGNSCKKAANLFNSSKNMKCMADGKENYW